MLFACDPCSIKACGIEACGIEACGIEACGIEACRIETVYKTLSLHTQVLWEQFLGFYIHKFPLAFGMYMYNLYMELRKINFNTTY